MSKAAKHFEAAFAEFKTALAEIRKSNAASDLRVKEALLADAREALEEIDADELSSSERAIADIRGEL